MDHTLFPLGLNVTYRRGEKGGGGGEGGSEV